METTRVVAGIDVHKKMLAVVIAEVEHHEMSCTRQRFGTSGSELNRLSDWMTERRVSDIAMESTAQYWRPVWMALEDHFHLYLAQARSTTGARGRKSDFADATRIVRRLLSGDLTLSYVPDAEQRNWRLLTRGRQQLIRERVRLQNQIEGLLEETRIKLSSVVSDLLGSSGRRILHALAAGETDPARLAALGDVRLQVSREGLQEALRGQLNPIHRTLLRLHLERLEVLDRQIAAVEQETAEAMRAQAGVITRLCGLPGLKPGAAQQIIAEIGPEAIAFCSSAKLASWVGVCPGRQESAGQSKSNRSAKGNRAMRALICQLAWAASKADGSYFQVLFRRLIPRLGIRKAIWAVAHRLLRVIWKVLHAQVDYIEFGPLALNSSARHKRKQQLIRELKKLGYTVELTPLIQGSSPTS
jgi:transposase